MALAADLALTLLSFKQALRSRILWGFAAFVLLLLFGSWFVPFDEYQVRNYVKVVFAVMTPLFLLVFGMLAAFSIPADLRSQTIHTIVTKPVERFEIVLGRFLGYALLMTLILGFMTGVSLLYLLREIDPDAQFENMKARVPIVGTLGFTEAGVNVGYEWEYRKYIAGGVNSKQRAYWTFTDLPSALAEHAGGMVPCEFTFDIYRTLKGEEGKGIFCSFTFQGRNWDPKLKPNYDEGRDRARKALQQVDRKAIIARVTQEVLEQAQGRRDSDVS